MLFRVDIETSQGRRSITTKARSAKAAVDIARREIRDGDGRIRGVQLVQREFKHKTDKRDFTLRTPKFGRGTL